VSRSQGHAPGSPEGARTFRPAPGWCAREVEEELPGLRLLTCELDVARPGSLTGSSPPDVRARLRELSNRMRGAGADHGMLNRFSMWGWIWLPRPRIIRPPERTWMSWAVCAVVIGERPSRLLTNAVAQLGGRLSYGVYLWHEVILVSYYYGTKQTVGTGSYPFVLALTLVLSFGFAWLTYRLVERPAQKLRPRLGRATADYRATASPEPVGAVPEPVTVPA